MRHRSNLRVQTNALSEKIIFEGKRAVGVAYRTNDKLIEARASGEVILSAGAVQSPQLLELSGIGDPEIIKEAGLEVFHALLELVKIIKITLRVELIGE